MILLTLREANKELEKLDNDYEYWLREKEQLLSLVMPKAIDPTKEVVQGGKREDRMIKYVELEEEKKINDTLNYIFKRKQNLIKWIDEELKILNKYGEVEQVIVQLKENTTIKDKFTNKERPLTWDEISKRVSYNKDHCRKIYRLYKKQRDLM